MALQPPFFGKRESDPQNLRGAQPTPGTPTASTPSNPLSHTLKPATTPANVNVATAPANDAPARDAGSKLTVGPNIKLKGVEITDCDTLVVEGLVEATMDSRVMQIAEQGAFKGSAEVDVAEIRGQFEGNLTVREKLVILSSGRVTGKIRYGKIIIEEGGQLAGEIQTAGAQKSLTLPGAASSTAALAA